MDLTYGGISLLMFQAADAVQKKLEQGQSASANDNNGGKTAASPAKTTSSPAKTSTAPAKTTTTPAKTTSTPAKTATAATDKNSANVYSLNKNKRKSEAGDGATGAKKKNSELTYKYVSDFFFQRFKIFKKSTMTRYNICQ